MSFEDTILLRLKRKYRDHEEVAFILSELSKARIRNGELLSEVTEANDRASAIKKEIDGKDKEISRLSETVEKLIRAKKLELTQEELVKAGLQELEQQNKALVKTNQRLSREAVQWRNKCLGLMAKNHNETPNQSKQQNQ